jgi:uncharacterized protein (DUF302 family)
MRTLLTAAAMFAASATLALAGPFVEKTSPHSVEVTIDRLASAVEGAGATVFARIDHAEGAAGAGMELRPATVLIFGNPKMGTPMMQSAGSMALDLPMKVAAYETADGSVTVVYRDIGQVAAEHGAEAPTVAKAAGALDKLTNAAVGTD